MNYGSYQLQKRLFYLKNFFCFFLTFFVNGESIAVHWVLSHCHFVIQYSIFVTEKCLLLFFDQLWSAMCTQIITDTHVTFWVTHKNNPNVRQIITLARSGLFMEYCCLVLGVCVWGLGEVGVYFKLISIKTKYKRGSLKSLLALWLFCLIILLILVRLKQHSWSSVLGKNMCP